jgi:hypothetical protein
MHNFPGWQALTSGWLPQLSFSLEIWSLQPHTPLPFGSVCTQVEQVFPTLTLQGS